MMLLKLPTAIHILLTTFLRVYSASGTRDRRHIPDGSTGDRTQGCSPSPSLSLSLSLSRSLSHTHTHFFPAAASSPSPRTVSAMWRPRTSRVSELQLIQGPLFLRIMSWLDELLVSDSCKNLLIINDQTIHKAFFGSRHQRSRIDGRRREPNLKIPSFKFWFDSSDMFHV